MLKNGSAGKEMAHLQLRGRDGRRIVWRIPVDFHRGGHGDAAAQSVESRAGKGCRPIDGGYWLPDDRPPPALITLRTCQNALADWTRAFSSTCFPVRPCRG